MWNIGGNPFPLSLRKLEGNEWLKRNVLNILWKFSINFIPVQSFVMMFLGFSIFAVTFLLLCHFWFRWPCLWLLCVSLLHPNQSTLRPRFWSFWSLCSWSCCTCSNSTRDWLSSFGLSLWVIYSTTLQYPTRFIGLALKSITCTCSSLLFLSLQDVFNSVFAAVYLIVLSLMALATYTVTGTLVGGVRNIFYSKIVILASLMHSQ